MPKAEEEVTAQAPQFQLSIKRGILKRVNELGKPLADIDCKSEVINKIGLSTPQCRSAELRKNILSYFKWLKQRNPRELIEEFRRFLPTDRLNDHLESQFETLSTFDQLCVETVQRLKLSSDHPDNISLEQSELVVQEENQDNSSLSDESAFEILPKQVFLMSPLMSKRTPSKRTPQRASGAGGSVMSSIDGSNRGWPKFKEGRWWAAWKNQFDFGGTPDGTAERPLVFPVMHGGYTSFPCGLDLTIVRDFIVGDYTFPICEWRAVIHENDYDHYSLTHLPVGEDNPYNDAFPGSMFLYKYPFQPTPYHSAHQYILGMAETYRSNESETAHRKTQHKLWDEKFQPTLKAQEYHHVLILFPENTEFNLTALDPQQDVERQNIVSPMGDCFSMRQVHSKLFEPSGADKKKKVVESCIRFWRVAFNESERINRSSKKKLFPERTLQVSDD